MSLLRGYINLQTLARRPVACVILSLRDSAEWVRFAPGSLCKLQSCCFPIPLVLQTFRFMLFTRCLPRFFNDLADFNARLGNRYGLGFTVSGLSPDKKRLA